MRFVGQGFIQVNSLNCIHSRKGIPKNYFSKEDQISLNKGWDCSKPAKIYFSKGKAVKLLDGRHRSAYFVLIGKPDYMVPVEFYTDD